MSLTFSSSARPTRSGHQRAQAGDGEEGGVAAAEPGKQRARAERRTERAHRQKHEGQEQSQSKRAKHVREMLHMSP